MHEYIAQPGASGGLAGASIPLEQNQPTANSLIRLVHRNSDTPVQVARDAFARLAHGLVGDGRPHAVRPLPSHALSSAERAELVRVANEPRFAAVPPARIVPMLADDGVYLASESTFSRVLRDEGQAAHRGRAKQPRAVRPPTTHVATAPRQVWCWDMTYLPAAVIGMWFHLYRKRGLTALLLRDRALATIA